MKLLKTTMMTAALMAVPTLALAQISVGSLTGAAKGKAAQTVLKNATPADTLTAGSTLLRGGSQEDAAVAVVKGRADQRVQGLTGGVSASGLSTNGLSTNGLSTNGLSTNGLSTNGLLGSGTSIASSRLGNSAASNIVPKSSNTSVLGQASGVLGSSGNTATSKLPKLGF